MYVANIIRYVLYFTLLLICAFTDYKKGKIYNKYLLKFLLIYILVYIAEYIYIYLFNKNAISTFKNNLYNNLLGFLIGFAIGFIFYIIGVFKGGDAKLIAVVGLVNGQKIVFNHFVTIIIVAGIIALYVMIKNKILISRFKRIFLYIRNFTLTGHFERYETDDNNIKFPFAIYILVGEIIINILEHI